MLRMVASAVLAALLGLGGLIGSPNAAAAATPTPPWDPFFAAPATVANFGATTRPFGIAAGDYDGDADIDLVVGRTTGNVALVRGNGDGTFQAPSVFPWKQAFFNAWAFAAADVNGDAKLDVVWGANAPSTGCSVSPVPVDGCPLTVSVNDGDVRAWLGNGDGTFQETTYFVSGVRHNAGVLIADIGTDAGSVTVGDLDGDGDVDIVAGAVDGTNSVVKLLRYAGAGVFTSETLISQATACATPCAPIYFPAISTQNSPWGLSLSDADGDGDSDLWVGDRALYTYLYRNIGGGAFTLQSGNAAVSGRPNVYLGHDSFRAAVGFTGSLGSGDVNGDGLADVATGLHSGTQTPASTTVNDGQVLLDVSGGGGHSGFGALADAGTMARGVTVVDVNGDGFRDIIAAAYDGDVKLLRQLPPIDTDNDGVSDYVDNAPEIANAARLDMNTDAATNHRDQLDNDFDTVLGDPENPATWQRLGDPADPDDDNDGVADADDNCAFTANTPQADVDGDGAGDACDPLDGRDPDGDGVPTGPLPGDPLYAEHLAAKIKWGQGDTHFVIRIDALGRFFQNEFTQLMTDAATLSAGDWAVKCWQNYDPGDAPSTSTPDPTYEPCGTGEGTPDQTLTLGGGKEVAVTIVVIPKQLWTDAPVVAWINDRNDSVRFELGQHGTYHFSNTTNGDWATLADRNFYSCEFCGLTVAENLELLRVGNDTLLGNYANRWIAESGATGTSPKIDWSTAAQPLIAYAPPFNADDATAREAVARLGFKSYSSSVHEEGSTIFTPEGSHHEQFDQFGMFHSSADLEFEPPEPGDTAADYAAYLSANTQPGELNTWLIEEVEWSGRPCNEDPRLTATGGNGPVTCAEGIAMGATTNRENNTVYQPRWDGWLQMLDYVRNYPGGVAMTMGEVAMAKAFDNAPTVANPDQADGDNNGVGDVIDGATLVATDTNLGRNQAGDLEATLTSGDGNPIAGQAVAFSFDEDGDGTDEMFNGTTDSAGLVQVSVTSTGPVGGGSFSVDWDGLRTTATDTGSVGITDAAVLTLDAANPTTGQVTDQVTVRATLTDSDGAGVGGRSITFAIGAATASGTTDTGGDASATLTLAGPAGSSELTASFAGDASYSNAGDSSPFTVAKEDTTLVLADAVVVGGKTSPVAGATLSEADGATLSGRTIEFFVEVKSKGGVTFVSIGTATTDADGVASKSIPRKYVSETPRPIRATFAGDASFLPSSDDAVVYRLE